MKPPKPPIDLPLLLPPNPSKTHKFNPSSFFAFFFLLQIVRTSSLLPTQTPPEYSKYCNDVVPESPVEPTTIFSGPITKSLDFRIGYFTGGDSIFFQSNISADAPKGVAFYSLNSPDTLYNSKTHIFKVKGKLGLQVPRSYFVSSSSDGVLNPRRGLRRRFRVRAPKIPVMGRGMPSFSLSGYWSETTGRLCMVGSGVSNRNADSKGESAWGFANPLFVADHLYQHQPYGLFPSALREYMIEIKVFCAW
ncbi:hypothetical protein CCACVL1_15670 [Corchorus capsularis]|uniref:DUF2921 domain-containing protein n=1 Tax=Corchorus capsularis TaxID=210143 RepID=A0A1R3I1H3_COCAP|nr:hypothetical protein CCACVL1_15670 [Corchorus capsularis]